ncbi:hypothetical protein K8R47_01650 [archaeon]|nr:hypothetical protein [archaeon]
MEDYKLSPTVIEGLKELQLDIAKTHSKVTVDKALSWFSEEIEELKEGIKLNDPENIKEELSQCMVWCLSIANILDIDLSRTVEKEINYHISKYPDHYKSQK